MPQHQKETPNPLGHPYNYAARDRRRVPSQNHRQHWRDLGLRIPRIGPQHRGLAWVCCQCYADLQEWRQAYDDLKRDKGWTEALSKLAQMVNVQHKMQDQYLKAMKELLKAVRDSGGPPPAGDGMQEFL